MSLETAISENTAAIHALIALLSQGGSITQATAAPSNIASDTEEGRTEETTPAVAEMKPALKAQTSASVDEAVSVTYQDAAKAIQDLAKTKGRDAAIAVLATFNASKLPEVKESDFAAVIKACEAA